MPPSGLPGRACNGCSGSYTARLQLAQVDPLSLGRYWSGRVEHLLRSGTEQRDVLPEAQSIDVRFADFMADEEAAVAAIYELGGQPLTEHAVAAMNRFRADHPRGRHGAVAYRAAPLGIGIGERREALRLYSDRFGVVEEDILN